MKNNTRTRTLISLLLAISLLALAHHRFRKKGDKNFKRGMDYEQQQQWDKAAQEFTLAVAADPSNMEYQLHFRRASFNASQTYMQQGRSLAEREILSALTTLSARPRLRSGKRVGGVGDGAHVALAGGEGRARQSEAKTGDIGQGHFHPASAQAQDLATPREQQMRVVDVKGDLKH